MDGVTFTPGERITHPELGAGVVLDFNRDPALHAWRDKLDAPDIDPNFGYDVLVF